MTVSMVKGCFSTKTLMALLVCRLFLRPLENISKFIVMLANNYNKFAFIAHDINLLLHHMI